eukprot:1146490-Pelagomonas_calceolata.AAC.4
MPAMHSRLRLSQRARCAQNHCTILIVGHNAKSPIGSHLLANFEESRGVLPTARHQQRHLERII